MLKKTRKAKQTKISTDFDSSKKKRKDKEGHEYEETRRYYPIMNPAAHHIYLKSLVFKQDNFQTAPNYGNAANKMLYNNFGYGKGDKTYEQTFTEAIDFLRAAAMNEEHSEEAYMLSVKQRLAELGFNTLADFDQRSDYMEYLKRINEAIVGAKEFKRRLEIEISRDNSKGKAKVNKTISQAIESYIKSNYQRVQQIYDEKGQVKKTTKNVFQSNKPYYQKKIGSFTQLSSEWLLRNLGTAFTNKQKAALTSLLQMTIIPILEENASQFYARSASGEVITKKFREGERNQLDLSLIETFLNNNFINIINQVNKANSVNSRDAKVWADGLINRFIKEEKKEINVQQTYKRKMTDKEVEGLAIVDKLMAQLYGNPEIDDVRTVKKTIIEDVVSWTPNTGIGAEYQDFMEQLKRKLVTFWQRGTQGSKSDAVLIIGKFIIKSLGTEEIGSEERSYKKKINPNKARYLTAQHFKKEYDKIANANIFEDYNEKSKALMDLYNEIDRGIKELDRLSQSFILHENVKDYMSAAAGQTTRDFGGFDLGSTGANLTATMNVIGEIAQYGNFDSIDIDLLTTLILNCSNQSLGSSNLEPLKKYLATFAAFFMFDDGADIARQAALAQYGGKTRNNLKVLHLFKANGIYFPASYIMNLIADVLEEANQYRMSDVANVTISHVNDIDFYGEIKNMRETYVKGSSMIYMWDNLSKMQMETVKLQIHMLKDFSNIIKALDK
jgi:hypothetical protein